LGDNFKAICGVAPILMGMLALQSASAAATGGSTPLLVSNAQLLNMWAQATGTATPEIVATADEGSRIVWQATATGDAYTNSSSGGITNTGMRDGSFHKLTLESDLRRLETGDTLNWFIFGLTNSDDRGMQSQPSLINTMHVGRTGPGYRVVLGDVPVNFSTLGASSGLRGVRGERFFGQTLVQGVVGVASPSWEALAQERRRSAYLRNAYAAKAQHPVTDALSMFLSVQGYADDEGSLDQGATALAPAEGQATTAGFAYRIGKLSLSGEAGFSNWQEDGIQEQDDSAYVIDGVWQGERGALQFGHHDIGVYYTSLSGLAMPGVRDTYAMGNWQLEGGIALNGNVRRTLNRRVQLSLPPTGTPNPAVATSADTDSWGVGASMPIKQVEGASVGLNFSGSDGENSDGSGNSSLDGSARLDYSRGDWTAGLDYGERKVDNSATTASNSTTHVWGARLGRQWQDKVAGLWSLRGDTSYRDSTQELDSGLETTQRDWSVTVSGNHHRWGTLSMSYVAGRLHDPIAVQTLHSRGWMVNAERSFSSAVSIRLYYKDSRAHEQNAGLAREERQAGIGLVVRNF
jgi:hypothetical protein